MTYSVQARGRDDCSQLRILVEMGSHEEEERFQAVAVGELVQLGKRLVVVAHWMGNVQEF
jgi:hypothetical protein